MGQDTLTKSPQEKGDTLPHPAGSSMQTTGGTQLVVAQPHATNAIQHQTTPAFTVETTESLSIYLLQPVDTASVDSVEEKDEDYLLACEDSILAPYADWVAPQRESMFAQREHSQEAPAPQLRQAPEGSDWVFGILTLLIALTSIYLNNQKFLLKDILQSLFDRRAMERVFRENNMKPRSLLPMTCIYLGALSLVANELICNIPGAMLVKNNVLQYLILFAGITTYYLIRNEVIRMFGALFEDRHATTLYISSNSLFYFIGGIGATPLTLLYFFAPGANSTLLTILGIFVAIVFVLRIGRSLQLILTNSKSSKLYLFYYLCIVEIIPILLVAKGIIS